VADATSPDFPLDDFTLDQIEHALGASYRVDEDGTHHVVGADFTLPRLLEFLSGFDPERSVRVGYVGDVPLYEHPDPVYSERDLLAALVAEVRRLRARPAGASAAVPGGTQGASLRFGFRRRCAWCGVALRGWQVNCCRRCKRAVKFSPSPWCVSASRWTAAPDTWRAQQSESGDSRG
jgi:hypothetical protein